jgi:hypothetical protein
MSEKTKVVFRVFKQGGDLVALFPFETWDLQGNCASYQTIGQHSGADYSGCIRKSRRALPKEYAALKLELERIGYNLDVKG